MEYERLQKVKKALSGDGLESANEQKILLHIWDKLKRTENALKAEVAEVGHHILTMHCIGTKSVLHSCFPFFRIRNTKSGRKRILIKSMMYSAEYEFSLLRKTSLWNS